MVNVRASRRNRSGGVRRAGHLLAALVNAVLLILINLNPGWHAVWFLTSRTPEVLGPVNLALAAGLVASVLYLFWSPRWLLALGGLVVNVISVYMLVRILRVFPFDFRHPQLNWTLIVQIVLVVGIIGTALGALGRLLALVRSGGRSED